MSLISLIDQARDDCARAEHEVWRRTPRDREDDFAEAGRLIRQAMQRLDAAAEILRNH